ncbi:uncharacterized protein LOC119677546 isoform X3 [Teleopsis dalmanni]|uniref:uncharacterized protein LOC119677546 isoform X3 n=1 Tax=Teleopsis dalmanni TaxID=139649 RepID=UPI0018CEE7FC|nr:uncharacterized protein LOC119677546 isoform X3 [Teleopsis dalmanni]
MEDIEYLEEYEDLVLPGMSKQSKTVQHPADGEDSSSIDQDIFESLFDSRSDDETAVEKKDPKLNRREDRSSMDSLDMLVKDLGEQLPTSSNVLNQTVDKRSPSKPTKTNVKGQTKKAGKNQELESKTDLKNKSNIVRLGKDKSATAGKPIENQNEQELISSTSRSGNVQSTSISPSLATSAKKFSTATSSTGVNKKKDPVQTIIKPEKPLSKDPADDPLAGIDSDTASDLLGSGSYTFSDMSDADDSYLSLSDIDNDDERQLLDDLNPPIENLDQIEIPAVYNSSSTPSFNAHNIDEQASSSVNSNISQSRNVSNRSEKEKITILSNEVLDRLDTSLLESLTGVTSKKSIGLDTKIEAGTLNSVLHEIVEALPEQEKSITTTDTCTTDTTTVMRFDDVTTTTQDVTSVTSDVTNLFSSNYNSSDNLIKQSQESNDTYFISTKEVSEQSNVTTTIIESKTDQYNLTDSLCDAEPLANTSMKRTDSDSNNKRNTISDTEKTSPSKHKAKTSRDSKINKKGASPKTKDESFNIGVSELKDILLNESSIASEYNDDVTTLQEIKDIYDEIDTQQKTNQIKEGKGDVLQDVENKSSEGETISTTKDLEPSIEFKKTSSKVLKKDFTDFEKNSEEKETGTMKKTPIKDVKQSTSQVNKKALDRKRSVEVTEVTNRLNKDKSVTFPDSKVDTENTKKVSEDKCLKNVKSASHLNTSKIKKDQSNSDKKLNKEKRNEDKTNTTDSKDAKNSNLTLVSNTANNDINEEEQITSQEAVEETETNKKSALTSNTLKFDKTNKEKQLTSQETSKELEINKRSTLTSDTQKNNKSSKDKKMTSQVTIKDAEVGKNTFFRSKETSHLKSKINSPKQDKYAANDNKKSIPNEVKRSLDVSETNSPENKETTNLKSKDSSKSPSKLVKAAQTNDDKKGNSKELRKDIDDKRVTSSDNKDVINKLSKEENISLSNEDKVNSKELKKDSSMETKDTKSLKSKEKLDMSKQEKPIQKIVDKKSTVSQKLKTSTNKSVKEICNVETKNISNIVEKSINEVEKSRTKNKQEKNDEKKDMSTKTEIQLSVSKAKEEEKNESKGYSSSKDEDSDNLKLQSTTKKFMENREDKNKTTPRKKDDQNNKKDTIKDSRNVSQQVQESTIGNQKTDKPTANEILMLSKNTKGSKEKVSTNISVVTSEPHRSRKIEISIAQSPSKTRNPSESPKRANTQVKTREQFKEPVEKLHKSGQDVQKPTFRESFQKSPSREQLSKSRSSSMSSEEKFSVGKPSPTQNRKETQGKKVELNKSQQKSEQGRKGIIPKQNTKPVFNQHESPSRMKVETENKDSRRSNSQTTNTKLSIENRDLRRSNSQTTTTRIETDNKDLRRSNSQTTNKRIENENKDLRRSNSQAVNTRIETDNRESRRSNFQSTNTKIGTENKDLRRSNSQINIKLETDNRETRQSDSQTTNVRMATENKDSRRSNSHTMKMETLTTAVNIKTDKISLRKSEIKEPNPSSTIKPTLNVESSSSKNKKSAIQTNIEGSDDKNEITPHIKILNKFSEKKSESKILPMPYENPQTIQKSVRDTSRESHKTPVQKIENKTDTLSKTEPKVTLNVKKNQTPPQKIVIKKSSLESVANKITETQGSEEEKEMKDLQSEKDAREKKESKMGKEDLNISVKNDNSFDKDIKKGTSNPVSEDKLVDNKVEEINAVSIPVVTKIKRDFNTRSIKNSDKEIESEETSKVNTSTANATNTKSIEKEPLINKNNETNKEDEIVKVTKDLMGSTLLVCSVKLAKNSLEDINKATDNDKNDSVIKEDGDEKIEKHVEQLKDEIDLKTTKTVSSKLEKADNTEDIEKSKLNSSNPTQTSDGAQTKLKSDKIDKNLMENNEEVNKNNTKPIRGMRNLRGKADVIVNISPKLKTKIESTTETSQINTMFSPKTLNEEHSRKHREQEGMDKSNIIEGIDPSRRSLRKRGTDSPMELTDARKIFKEPTNTDLGRKDLNVRIDSPAPVKRSAALMDSIATKISGNEDQHPVKRQKLGIRREIRGKSKDFHSKTITAEEIEMVPSSTVSELLSCNKTTERNSDTTYVRETRSSSSLSIVDANLSESKDKDSSADIAKNIKSPLESSKKICPEIETSDTIFSRNSNEEVVPRKLTRSQAASIVEEDKSLNFNMLTENILKVGLEDLDNCKQDISNKKNLRSKIITIDVVKSLEDRTLNYVDEDTSTASETSINPKNIDYLVQGNEEAKSVNYGENSEKISKMNHLVDTNEANVSTEKLQSVVTEEALGSNSERIEICVEGDRKEKVDSSKVSTIKIFSDFEKPKRIKEIDILRASMPLEMRESGFENMYSEGKLRTKSSLSVVSPVPNERTRIIKSRIIPERPASCVSQIKTKSAKHKKQSQHDISKPKQLKKLRVRINRSIVDKYLKTINNTIEITNKLEVIANTSSTIRSRSRHLERDAKGHFSKSVLPKTVLPKTVLPKTVLPKTVLPKTKTTSEAKTELANSAGTSFVSKAVEAAAASKEVIDRRAEKTPLVRLSQLNTHLRTRISEVSKGVLSFQQQQPQLPDFNTPTSSHQPEDVNKRVKTDDEDGNLLTPLKATAFTTLRKQVTDEETKPLQQQLPKRVSTLQAQNKDKPKNKLDKNVSTPALPTQSPVLASLINAKSTLPSSVLIEPNKEFTARINASTSATLNIRTPNTTSPKVLPFIEPKQEIEEYSSSAYNINSTPTSILPSTASSILPSSHQSTQSPVATLPTTTGISPTIVDANGTRLYSFLHPAKYNRGYGGVLLDYCCPNLDGPMPAIDPTRIHARTQAVVRELPAYIVMTTKLITRADLETDKNSIPASIRHKVEMLTASSSTPATSTQGPPALQPLQPSHLSSTINALQRQLPSTTTLTPKNIKSLQSANIADTPPSPATTSNLKTPVSLPEYQRSLLRSSVQRFDLTLTKLIQLNLSKMSFSERQRVVDSLSNLNKFSSKDIDCAVRLMEEYMLILNTPPPIIPSIQPTTSLTAVKTSTPQQKEIVNDMARKTKAPRPQQQRKMPVQKQQPQKEQHKNNEQYLPILDADQNIIGFKYQDVSSTSQVTKPTMSTRVEPSSTVPDLRSSTIKNLLKKSNATTKNLKLPAQESPRIFYAKPPLQSSTPIPSKSTNTSLSLRSNQRSCLPYRQFNTPPTATTVTGPPPPKRPAISAAPISSLISGTPFGSLSVTSPTMTQTTTIASKSVILEATPKRTTRTAAAAAASTTKVIIITSDQQADECILPDDTRSTAIKSENIDEDFIGGN